MTISLSPRGIRFALTTLILGAFAGIGGCGILLGALQPSEVVVALVNDGDYPVEGELCYSDEDDTVEELLEEFGTKRVFALAAGEESEFSLDCEELRAIILSKADLQLIGEVGPSTGTDVIRDGVNFECGDRIEFRFDHSDLILDFDVDVSVRNAE